MSPRELWRRAARMAAISSTFSTLFVWAGARQVGRDPQVDFMQVGMVPLRQAALDADPRLSGVGAGVAVHQAADVMWALIFFRWLLPRSRRSAAATIVAGQLPWALATAGAEYWLFLPWVQPWLRMQVPFWTAAGVHVSSALAYGLWGWVADSDDPADRRLAAATATAMAGVLIAAGALTWRTRQGRAPAGPAIRRGREAARSFLADMAGHHRVGLELSLLAAECAHAGSLRALGRLMAAQHRAELELMDQLWRSWFDGALPELDDDERQRRDAIPSAAEVADLARRTGQAFDRRFVEIMIPHHLRAVAMSQDVLRDVPDPRIAGFAAGIAHTQIGQVDAMREIVYG